MSTSLRGVLLLLPEAPPSSLRSLYTQPLRVALRKALEGSNNGSPNLDVAIALNVTQKDALNPRTRYLGHLEYLLACVYQLLGRLNMEDHDGPHEIGPTAPADVGARVFFVIPPKHTGSDNNYGNTDEASSEEFDSIFPSPASKVQGPIVSLQGLASSSRSWNMVFSLATPTGELLWDQFIFFVELTGKILPTSSHQRVHGDENEEVGSVSSQSYLDIDENDVGDNERHYSVAVGGTFDHLHMGHKLLLTLTALALDPSPSSTTNHAPQRLISVGVMDDDLLVSKKYAEVLEPWETRAMAVLDFLVAIMAFESSPMDTTTTTTMTDHEALPYSISHVDGANAIKPDIRASFSSNLVIDVARLRDCFGPTLDNPDVSVLVVSRETRRGADATNEMRRAKDWKMMKILEIGVLSLRRKGDNSPTETQDEFASKISSTKIRRCLMNS